MRKSLLLKCKKVAEELWVKNLLLLKKDAQEEMCPCVPTDSCHAPMDEIPRAVAVT